jgi:hypothetical protein
MSSTTVTFSYRIIDDGGRQNAPEPDADPFRRLRGVAKEVFRSLGGGEAFLRGERSNSTGPESLLEPRLLGQHVVYLLARRPSAACRPC